MKYLNTKPGSIEEIAANMSKHQNESGYQDMFKKELEKAGKGIGSMTPAEKKAFFNKIDDKYKAKNENVSDKQLDTFHKKLDNLVHKTIGKSSDEKKEAVDNPYAVGMAQAMKSTGDKPPLKKSTITKAHDIAKSIEKDKKEEVEETHSFMTKDMNQSKKDAKGEKEIVDPEPKIKQESLQDAIKSVWQLSAEELEKMKSEAKYMKAQRMNQYKAEKDDKNKTGTADTGSKKTKVDVEPSVDYKN